MIKEDELWDALYDYLMDVAVEPYMTGSEHSSLLKASSDARKALDALLTPKQAAALETFLTARDNLMFYEDEVSFREAVLLGKWMAR